MGLCLFSTRTIHEFSTRSSLIWRAIIFRFVWNGQSSILSHLQVWRTCPWRYVFPYFFFFLCIHFLISLYQILSLLCCRHSWIGWLFCSRFLILAPLPWVHFVFPLLKTSCKKVLTFMKKMSFPIRRTCPWCLGQGLKSHFKWLESSIHSHSKPSLKFAPK